MRHMNRSSFADLPWTPASHFTLYFYVAVSQILATAASRLGSRQALCDRFPFVDGYVHELVRREHGGLTSCGASRWWQETIAAWETEVSEFLPVRALRDAAGLDHDAMTLVFSVGLLEEDARFGAVFEALHGCAGQQRPSVGLLTECWNESSTYEPFCVVCSMSACCMSSTPKHPASSGPSRCRIPFGTPCVATGPTIRRRGRVITSRQR
jgi:hypothetical protein